MNPKQMKQLYVNNDFLSRSIRSRLLDTWHELTISDVSIRITRSLFVELSNRVRLQLGYTSEDMEEGT